MLSSGKRNFHVLGRVESGVVVRGHLLVKGLDLVDGRLGAVVLLDDSSLRGKDLFEHLDGIIRVSRLVSQATEADGIVRLVVPRSLYTVFHKSCHVGLVFGPIPRPELRLVPLVSCALHGLVVRRRDKDAVVIGQLLVSRVVGEEDVSWRLDVRLPHGGP